MLIDENKKTLVYAVREILADSPQQKRSRQEILAGLQFLLWQNGIPYVPGMPTSPNDLDALLEKWWAFAVPEDRSLGAEVGLVPLKHQLENRLKTELEKREGFAPVTCHIYSEFSELAFGSQQPRLEVRSDGFRALSSAQGQGIVMRLLLDHVLPVDRHEIQYIDVLTIAAEGENDDDEMDETGYGAERNAG